jgi:hypothetical protein
MRSSASSTATGADKKTDSLEKRPAEEAKSPRAEARKLPPGIEQERLLPKPRQADTASHLTEWLMSPGLKVVKACPLHFTEHAFALHLLF